MRVREDGRPAAPARPGDRLLLEIESLAAEGDGVGRHGGLAVFVPQTAPGDRVEVVVTEAAARFARAPDRRAAPRSRRRGTAPGLRTGRERTSDGTPLGMRPGLWRGHKGCLPRRGAGADPEWPGDEGVSDCDVDQLLPTERVGELIYDLTGHRLGEGTLYNLGATLFGARKRKRARPRRCWPRSRWCILMSRAFE